LKNPSISLRKFNRNLQTLNSKNSLRVGRLPVKNQAAFYYVKPKQKKGPTISGWLKFGAVIVGAITGVVVYTG